VISKKCFLLESAQLVPRKDEDPDSKDVSLLGKLKKLAAKVRDSANARASSVEAALLKSSFEDPGPLAKILREKVWIDNLVWIHGQKTEFDTGRLEDWDRFYETPFRPKNFSNKFLSSNFGQSSTRNRHKLLTFNCLKST
jgi:hypothetical protein